MYICFLPPTHWSLRKITHTCGWWHTAVTMNVWLLVVMHCRLNAWRRGTSRRSRGGRSSWGRITSGQTWIRFTWVSSLCCFYMLWCVIDVASGDTISRPLQRKRPVSDPPLTYNSQWSFSELHFLVAEKGTTQHISCKCQGKYEDMEPAGSPQVVWSLIQTWQQMLYLFFLK